MLQHTVSRILAHHFMLYAVYAVYAVLRTFMLSKDYV